eukprot:TRINITY_DN761_c0_g1_i1.p1 TRINITY_DN761_c0_g1~~TRINITY_DN761_c0_g1_i1.p1  ORF type:complete len:303 (+),score=25.34 TRINITY_DN761_c0_g1_i1:483-1391(+)
MDYIVVREELLEIDSFCELDLGLDSLETIRSDISDFALLCSEFVGFSITASVLQKGGLDTYFRRLVQQKILEDSSVNFVVLQCAENISLKCSMEVHIQHQLTMPAAKYCACHGKRCNTFSEGYFCSHSLERLDNQDINNGFSFGEGSTVLNWTHRIEAPSNAILEVVHMCPLASVSEELLFGNPVVLSFNVAERLDWESFKKNKYLFCALCKKLAQRGQGLIAFTKTQDLYGNQSCPHLRHYYLLLPSVEGCYFLAKSLTVEESILPPRSSMVGEIEIPSPIEELVDEFLTKVGTVITLFIP